MNLEIAGLALLIAGGIGVGLVQFVKWVFTLFKKELSGTTAVIVTLIVSLLISGMAAGLTSQLFQDVPTDPTGWVKLISAVAGVIFTVATVVYRAIWTKVFAPPTAKG